VNVADVMDALADRLDTIDGLRVFAWPVGTLTPPGAVVGYPVDGAYDESYGRGADSMVIPVVVVVGRVSERASRDLLAAYADGSGTRSIKAVLEGGTYTAFDTVQVRWPDFDSYTVAGVDYLAEIFDVAVFGKGSS
jgi:hypothetical protein